MGSEELIVPLAAAQRLFNLPGQINAIKAQLTSGSDDASVQQAVLAVVVGLGFGIVGALIPARQAVRLEIVRALAFE